MKKKLIYGIQQIGIGVKDAEAAFKWYATRLGADISVFEDSNPATYMAPYMGGKARKKKAILAMNLEGGSGYELWQYLEREPQPPQTPLKLGDLGINIGMVKSRDLQQSYSRLQHQGVDIRSGVQLEPDGKSCFYIADPYGNLLKVKEFNSWYTKKGMDTGGIYGCTLGVSDIEASLKLYSDILGYSEVVFDRVDTFEDLSSLPNGNGKFRRVVLSHPKIRRGGFSRLFGESRLELLQAMDYKPNRIFEDRFWGDLGFIHLCFDIRHMHALTEECAAAGFPFKVLSKDSFDMGDANGHWGYLEDPDGTLIEFVETHKVPLMKNLGWYINLKKRDPQKPLPKWLINAMRFKRRRFKSR